MKTILLAYGRKMGDFLISRFANTMPAWELAPQLQKDTEVRTYYYKLPNNYDNLPTDFAKQYVQKLTIKPHKVFCLTKVYATWQGMVFKNFRIFIPSLQSLNFIHDFQETLLLKQWLGPYKKRATPKCLAIVHSQFGPENYFHWMIDSLQRLILLKQYYSDIPLVVLDPMTEFVAKTVEALGFANIIKLTKNEVLQIDELILPQHVAPPGHADPVLVKNVRDELVSKLGKHTVRPYRKLFISRDKQKSRRVANQKDIDYLLDRYGFETIYFEGLSVQEQIQVAQETAVLVSVHGANLVNLIFMNPETTVIELTSETLHSPIYWRLSSLFMLSYYVLPCSGTVSENVSFHSNADIIVDETKFEELLELVTNG